MPVSDPEVTEAISSEVGTELAEQGSDRLRLYTYLTVQEHRTYLAIMRLFTSTLLADLSAAEVASALAQAEAEGRIDPGESHIDKVLTRLDQLRTWGNLIRGTRETNTKSIAEFLYGRWRFQVTKLAVRVQRDVEELIAVPEGATEVTRELLPALRRGLEQITRLFAETLTLETTQGPDAPAVRRSRELLAEAVTTVFLQQGELAATVRDFYAYLGQVVARHDLNPQEIGGFRGLLVEYIQIVVDDVLLHSPEISKQLAALERTRPDLLRLLEARQDLGERVERADGRSQEDWEVFTAWFVDRPGGKPSQVTELRRATSRAIGALLANVRRSSAGAIIAPSRRQDLLRLARVFDQSTQEQAHALYAAVFGSYSARHLLLEGDSDAAQRAVAWREARPVEVSVSVAERPERAGRGRAARIRRDPLGDQLARQEAQERAQARRAALAELVAAADDLEAAVLSPAALSELYELVRAAMSQRSSTQEQGRAGGAAHGVSLTLHSRAGVSARVRSHLGTLTLRDTALVLERTGRAGAGRG